MKEKMYKNYISTHYGTIHDGTDDEFRIYGAYFKENYLKHIPKNCSIRILDVGCGMGHFLQFLEDHGYNNYLGIDISEENIAYCKANKKFNVELVDAFKFFQNNTMPFDVIVMNDIIEHFDKNQIIQLLELIYGNLNENGILIVKTVNSSNPLLGSSSRYFDFTHEVGFTEESLSQVLKVSNFKNIAIYPTNIYIFFTNPLNYIAKFASLIFNKMFKFLFILYGRKGTNIFTKDMIAVARK
jgi:2-polyprenyl-3-methyl-5-hydroxy-6-metoxy-1,4-benzoquinol methylase